VQVAEHEVARKAAQVTKAADLAAAVSDITAFQAEEAAKAKAAAAVADRLKQDRQRQVGGAGGRCWLRCITLSESTWLWWFVVRVVSSTGGNCLSVCLSVESATSRRESVAS